MSKLKTKRDSSYKKIFAFCIVFILLIGGVAFVKIINNNKQITELMSRDVGSFESEASVKGDTKEFRLSIYDKDIDTKYYKKEWNLDLNPKKNNFVYKDGLPMNGSKITAGTWKRDNDGDYKLYVGGKIYAYIIEKPNTCGFIKKQPNYVMIFAKNGEKHNIKNLGLRHLWYYSRVKD